MWFENLIIFIFSYGWFFGLIPIILGIIGAIYFSQSEKEIIKKKDKKRMPAHKHLIIRAEVNSPITSEKENNNYG